MYSYDVLFINVIFYNKYTQHDFHDFVKTKLTSLMHYEPIIIYWFHRGPMLPRAVYAIDKKIIIFIDLRNNKHV